MKYHMLYFAFDDFLSNFTITVLRLERDAKIVPIMSGPNSSFRTFKNIWTGGPISRRSKVFAELLINELIN